MTYKIYQQKYQFITFETIAIGWIGVAESKKSEATMSDLAMANVEALAQYEGSGDDFLALCEWSDYQYCNYYVTFPDGVVMAILIGIWEINNMCEHSNKSAIYFF